ncbi:hypothetical protein ABT173_28940 [Streptomyces sp. NPDC001795]|uniref:hypothetical protein n=1 Tax=Streptomyces sp. NPDC001795 TaxID=3154525 RepID=UPI00333469AF
MTQTLLFGAGIALGYLLRCWRPVGRAVSWARCQERGSAAWWLAQPVLAVAVVALFVGHPRRSRRNVRSWRVEPPLAAPRLDPEWLDKRRAP